MDDDDLPLRAGPAPTSPPLPIALMILAVGIAGPFVFVRDAVPSLFLTIAALLVPIAGGVAVIASVGSLRRRWGDAHVRTRAVIGADGIALMARRGDAEHYIWVDIIFVQVSRSVLTLHIRGDGGKRGRRAMRYSALETPIEMLEARIARHMTQSRTAVAETSMS